MDYDYFEVKIPCNKEEVDAIEDFLLSIGACSVTYRDAEDVAILEPAPGEMPLWNDIEITGMFTSEFSEGEILDSCNNKFQDREVRLVKLKNRVWERTWLEHFKPMKFGSHTWIIPSEFNPVEKQDINIYLDPGLAFGTGTHATTALCLEWIDNNKMESSKVIDFGCGSGILAIAALKHGAMKAYCTDIDLQAIESTRVNAKNNHVFEGIEIVEKEAFSDITNLDVILANILAGPLMTLTETFYSMLKPRGILVMSGILKEQTDEIVEAFSHSFVDFQINIKEDWALVTAIRK